MPDLLSAALR